MSILHVAPREQSTSTHSDPPCLVQALLLRNQGFWPCLIHPPGIKRRGQKELTKGKEPVGKDWGATRKTEDDLRKLVQWAKRKGFTPHGCGICLGPKRAPGGGWLIDLEGDGSQAEESLRRLLGGELVETYGWSATRGDHALFKADGELLLKLLKEAGGVEGKGHEAGKFTLSDFPGLEFRIGRYGPDGRPLQFQSVAPPTPGTDGRPRVWNGVDTIAELPETAYEALEAIAERMAIQEANHVVWTDCLPLTGGNGAVKLAGGNGAVGDRIVVKQEGRRPSPEERAAMYLQHIDAGTEGERGSNPMFRAACAMRVGFDLDRETCFRLLRDVYGPPLYAPLD